MANSKILLWQFKDSVLNPTPRSLLGFVQVSQSLAEALVAEGSAQWPRIGAFRFNFIQPRPGRGPVPVQWAPGDLFGPGDEGTWFDFGDMSLLFQDSEGLVPITAVGQPIGLVRDKSGSGNHIQQATAAQRPLYSARKNFLLSSDLLASQDVAVTIAQYTLSHSGSGSIAVSMSGVHIDTLNGPGRVTFVTQQQGVITLEVNGTVVYAQLEFGSAATRYQRVVSDTDYDTVGFPHYMLSNGVSNRIGRIPAGMHYPVFSHIQCGLTQNLAAVGSSFIGPGLDFFHDSVFEGATIIPYVDINRFNISPAVWAQSSGLPSSRVTFFTPLLPDVDFYMPSVCMATYENLAQALRMDGGPIYQFAHQYSPISESGSSRYMLYGTNQHRMYDGVTINRKLTDTEYDKYREYVRVKVQAPSPPWTPLQFFREGEQGTWFDFSDMSTLFQDHLGAVPVTALGQPVGLVLDKSGSGNHIQEATASRRPAWTRLSTGGFGITGDGIDDRMGRSASGMEWPEFSYLCVGSSAALGDIQGTLNFGPFLEFWHTVNWQGFGAFLRTAVGGPEHPRADLEVYDTDAIFTTLSSTKFRPVFANQPVVLSTYCEDNLQTVQINGDSKWSGSAPYTPISPVGNSNLIFRANGVVWNMSDAVLINRRITDTEFNQYITYAEQHFGVVTP